MIRANPIKDPKDTTAFLASPNIKPRLEFLEQLEKQNPFARFLVNLSFVPNFMFQEAKEKLHEIQKRKSQQREKIYIEILRWLLANIMLINHDIQKEMLKELQDLSDLITKDGEQKGLKKWTIIRVVQRLSSLEEKYKKLNDNDQARKNAMVAQFKLFKSELANDFDERNRKFAHIKKNGKDFYIKEKSDPTELSDFANTRSYFRFTAKNLKTLFLILGIIGLILSIVATLAFPPLCATAGTIVAIATIGYCALGLLLYVDKLMKWLERKLYYKMPLTKAQIFNGVVNLFFIIINVVFLISGVTFLLPATGGGLPTFFSNFPTLSKIITTIQNFLFNNANIFNTISSVFSLLSKCTISAIAAIKAIVSTISQFNEWRDFRRAKTEIFGHVESQDKKPQPEMAATNTTSNPTPTKSINSGNTTAAEATHATTDPKDATAVVSKKPDEQQILELRKDLSDISSRLEALEPIIISGVLLSHSKKSNK